MVRGYMVGASRSLYGKKLKGLLGLLARLLGQADFTVIM
jgi:hypothetical protein